ncbi:hypothetical protein PFISCL1PPCAC_6948, partial [Pristionchus fissidentatus]
ENEVAWTLQKFVGGEKHRVQVGPFITTVVPPTVKTPLKKVEFSVIRKAVEFLSQPTLNCHQIDMKVDAKRSVEDPCLSSRRQLRPARRRGFSQVRTENPFKRSILSHDDRKEIYDLEWEPANPIGDDPAYNDYEDKRFISYCRNRHATPMER